MFLYCLKNKLANFILKKVVLIFFFCFYGFGLIGQITYIENFDDEGYPSNLPNGAYWEFYNEIHPSQDSWKKFIPGDGNAYIIVDADKDNDLDHTYPFQTLVFGGIGENHRLEVRMKGAAVDGGLAAFIFTYRQTGAIFNEVDIEVVAQDLQAGSGSHEIYAPDGWTDARFNTWRDANETTELPFTGSQKPVVDSENKKVSLIDDEFHTYTIEWGIDKVEFFIDEVLQESFTTNIAKGWSEVIIGYRNLPWAGDFNWSGEHVLVIDYFKIEPLNTTLSNNTTEKMVDFPSISLYPNPVKDLVNIKISNKFNIDKIELHNLISSKITGFKTLNSNQQIDISELPKGVYFLKIKLTNGNVITEKILKI